MKIFEFALETEKMAKDFFQGLAQRSPTVGPRNIFASLAAEQDEIVAALTAMKPEFLLRDGDSKLLDEAAGAIYAIFREHLPARPPKNDLEAYHLAVAVERAVVGVFEGLLAKESNRDRNRLLEKVAEQEARHCAELEQIYDFVTETDTAAILGAEADRGMQL